MTSDELRDMAQKYVNVDEVVSTCLTVLADLSDALVNEVNNIWRVLKPLTNELAALREELRGHKHLKEDIRG